MNQAMEAEIIDLRPCLRVALHHEVRLSAEFEHAVRCVLERHGRPMDKHALFVAVQQQYPELTSATKTESFRRRIWKIRDVIRYDAVTGGYWFIDKPATWPPTWEPPEKPSQLPKVRGPFEHYGVLAEECGCPLCVEWRAWRDASAQLTAVVGEP